MASFTEHLTRTYRARTRDKAIAKQLAFRLASISFWRGVMCRYPGGVIRVDTAARAMGTTVARIEVLIRQGRIPCVCGAPGRYARDRYIPIDALAGLTTPLDTGRGVGWNMGIEWQRDQGERYNPWLEWHTDNQPVVQDKPKRSVRENSLKNLLVPHLTRLAAERSDARKKHRGPGSA